MRREDFTIDVDVDAPTPGLTVTFTGTPGALRDRLGDGEPLATGDVDVTYRRTAVDDPGVLGVTDRLTGEFVLEAPLAESTLQSLVSAASATEDGEGRYHLRIEPVDGDAVEFEKRTLLVYDAAEGLDRDHSLIPAGVEL